MANILDEMGIEYSRQHRIDNRYYDFYVPKSNMLIEVAGRYWHSMEKQIPIDKIKNHLAKDNNYALIRVWDDEIDHCWRIV
jgi:very-short-patch-repair endonuclease